MPKTLIFTFLLGVFLVGVTAPMWFSPVEGVYARSQLDVHVEITGDQDNLSGLAYSWIEPAKVLTCDKLSCTNQWDTLEEARLKLEMLQQACALTGSIDVGFKDPETELVRNIRNFFYPEGLRIPYAYVSLEQVDYRVSSEGTQTVVNQDLHCTQEQVLNYIERYSA